MVEITLTIKGQTKDDLVTILKFVTRQISEGYTSSSGRNGKSAFKYDITGEEETKEEETKEENILPEKDLKRETE